MFSLLKLSTSSPTRPSDAKHRSVASLVYVRRRDRSVDPRGRLVGRFVFFSFSSFVFSFIFLPLFFSLAVADAIYSLEPTRFRLSLRFFDRCTWRTRCYTRGSSEPGNFSAIFDHYPRAYFFHVLCWPSNVILSRLEF